MYLCNPINKEFSYLLGTEKRTIPAMDVKKIDNKAEYDIALNHLIDFVIIQNRITFLRADREKIKKDVCLSSI